MHPTKFHSVQEATRKMERFCAYQERCHKEVVQKLKDMRMIPQAIDQIIAHLIEANFLNEERFAKSFARGKFNQKKWGKTRIVRELRMREISRFNINSALAEITDEAYRATFDELAEKKAAQIEATDLMKKRRKLADYLLYRGWESDLVYQKVYELT
ncbi:MAG: RecX family transcriptional regulator [Flavobacteriaceae bacterium]|nr:RecX family transcriptional regulator [Flavobacteriaceae bacterium]